MGFFIIFVENPEGRGGLPFFLKKWRIRGGGGGGSLVNFPPWWGYGYFLEPHNECIVVHCRMNVVVNYRMNIVVNYGINISKSSNEY